MLELVHKEYKGLDIMKFVMAIVVVAIHTRPEMSFNSSLARQIFEAIYSLAVPFFFIASGFLLFRKISLPLTEEGEQRIKSYLSRMCRLYLVWTIIYLPLTIYGFYLDGLSPVKAGVVFLRNILLVGENYMSWPLWYLLALIVAIGIIYVLLKLNVTQKWIVVCGILTALVGLGLDYCRENAYLQPITDLYFAIFVKTRNGFFEGFLFVALGMLCSNLKRISSSALVTLLFVGILGMLYQVPLSKSMVVCAIFGAALCVKASGVSNEVSAKLRNVSTIVYFTHMLFISPIIMLDLTTEGFILFAISIVLSVLLGFCFFSWSKERFYTILF